LFIVLSKAVTMIIDDMVGSLSPSDKNQSFIFLLCLQFEIINTSL